MENGKWKTENEEREGFFAVNRPISAGSICSACGAPARRKEAKFCETCGKLLSEDYQPLDTFRSSYRLQGKSFLIENRKHEEMTNLFERNENSVAQTAWACVVYSMVPYLGILFVPFAFFVGGFGYVAANRRPDSGGRKLALACVAMSLVILAVQIFLWWPLYIIPELGKGI